MQQLQQSLRTRQEEYRSIENERAKLESEAGRVSANLTAVEARLLNTQQLLADAEAVTAAVTSKLEAADQERSDAQKQLLDARTGIRNLRNRIDESEADLKRTRVQSSLQVCISCAWCLLETEMGFDFCMHGMDSMCRPTMASTGFEKAGDSSTSACLYRLVQW